MAPFSGSVRNRLFAAFVAVGLGVVALVGTVSVIEAEQAARENLEERAKDRTAVLAQLATTVMSSSTDDGLANLAESVRALGNTTRTGYTLITTAGSVLVESMPESSAVAPLDQPEVSQAAKEGVGVDERDGFLHVATPVVSDGVKIGYAIASVPSTRIATELESLETRIEIACALAALAVFIAAWLLASRFSRAVGDVAPFVKAAPDAPAAAPQAEAAPVETFKRNLEPLAISLDVEDTAHPQPLELDSGAADDPTACDVAFVMSDVESAMSARAKEKGIALLFMLDTPVPETITCNTMALRQLLTRMVQNAIDMTTSGSVSVHASFDPQAKPARRLNLTVCDTGSGIAKEQLPEALSPLKDMASELEGSAEATSTVGEGSSFTIVFPTGIRSAEMVDALEPLPEPAPAADAAPPAESAPAADSTPPLDSAPPESGPAVSPSIGAPPPTDRSPGLELAS